MSADLKKKSLAAGITIVAGTAVGAGMFSLPIVSSGMWFSWSVVLLLFTWFCMYTSSLLILETNLNFEAGASFDTFIGKTLGPRWNLINTLTLTFVLYILTYAYVSGGGSIVTHTLQASMGYSPPQIISGLIFALGLASVVWFSTAWVGRVTTVLVTAMVITFLMTVSGLTTQIRASILFENKPEYALFGFAAIPYFLTSFGYHGNVPSLVRHYGKDPASIGKCLLYGSLVSLLVYTLWHVATLGNIPREQFPAIVAEGGNIGSLVGALNEVADVQQLSSLLTIFANLTVVSSFLGVTLGLFDFIADKFKFDDGRRGRFNTALVTFLPPTVAGLLFPNGFIYAIGLAGLCACMWGTIIPALAARRARELFGSPGYRVWGGEKLIWFICSYGVVLIICYLLAAIGLLPRLGY